MKITKNVSPEDKKIINKIFWRSFTVSASRAYEANSTVIEGAKSMFSAALEIGNR